MRRSRKPRVVWLPQTNANSLDTAQSSYQATTLAVANGTGTTGVVEIPMVLDAQQGIFDPNSSLADIESSGYRLRRIVGKIWCICGQSNFENLTNTPINAIATCGIIVRRADTLTGQSLATLADPTGQQVHPGIIDNTGDPWVWRRSWFLGNNTALANRYDFGLGAGLFPSYGIIDKFPQANWEYGSVADGPHIDQKTARVVGPEERLFLTWSVMIVTETTIADPAPVPLNFALFTDFRILGSLRTSSGNRGNSSR